MLVFGTQIHIVTFIFILLETWMLIFQFFYYLFRPDDKSRLWYLFLLILLLFYNVTGGLFPDPKLNLTIQTQEMIAYGSGFLMASYFPFYFYKAFDLKPLRWHALFGVPLFLITPYIIFFIVVYTIYGNLNTSLKYGMIVPFIYALVLLWVMFSAIRKKHGKNRNDKKYLEEIMMYFAISPWAALAVFGFVEESQLVEVLVTNTGIIAISFLFMWKSIKSTREEHSRLLKFSQTGITPQMLEDNARIYGLTKTEIEIVHFLSSGMNNRTIAETLFISEETVKKHIYNAFRKTSVKNRQALLYLLRKKHT
ncbi:response regulator transcription factor [Mucilaginibacter aquaedulcis]|uniref:response regulator transcription factor n=1 Tax=Mucilaginibacter aquaedulcis TaxID=1187081 RepID=UPI0025B605BD|nr:LuxR C-terminal-related transcriptional regulator [Mucilaginibacter aquaedulcis]MDN3548962.1 LuxR C-terminal-related transcriptional regulator [Mucilaginibacter aquaedulcis]